MQFQMQMRPGAVTCGANQRNPLPLAHLLPRLHQNLTAMRIKRLPTVAMLQNHSITINIILPAGLQNCAAMRRQNRRSLRHGNIQTMVRSGAAAVAAKSGGNSAPNQQRSRPSFLAA